jgi:SAM-dependent methyltransferase
MQNLIRHSRRALGATDLRCEPEEADVKPHVDRSGPADAACRSSDTEELASPSRRSFLEYLRDKPVEHQRYLILRQALGSLRTYFADRRVLDFGAGSGLSMCALLELGAAKVVGVEPDHARVRHGQGVLRALEATSATLLPISYSGELPFSDGAFDVVLANAVLEHIPPPRRAYVRELWRVLAVGGHLLINESPNKYLPVDLHTTGGLWFVPWLPGSVARQYAVYRGRFRKDGCWRTSGWRGIGYFEIARATGGGYKLIAERSRRRHTLLTRLGLPASLLDPYPTLVFEKVSHRVA